MGNCTASYLGGEDGWKQDVRFIFIKNYDKVDSVCEKNPDKRLELQSTLGFEEWPYSAA